MKIERVPFREVPQFSERDIAYATGDPRLTEFRKYPVSLEAFVEVLKDKAADNTDRDLLVDTLERQYSYLPKQTAVNEQLSQLRSRHTYTVITAHQPSLFTGPLYYILKICSTINLSNRLNARYPEHHIVPVFISGAEDHDFEEVNHTHLFGNRIEWHGDEGKGGPVGKRWSETLHDALTELQEVVGCGDRAQEIYLRIKTAYLSQTTYGIGAIALVHELFGRYGLVVADMGWPAFKLAFRPLMERELFESVSQPLVEKTQNELSAVGFGSQAHAREINLFYLSTKPSSRDRLERVATGYRVIDRDLSFTEEELRRELNEHPERFSPNVVMRPLFQELIFPNLAYIGGGGEIAYWLERKAQFGEFGLNFPMLIRRNSVLWIGAEYQDRLENLGINYRELFQDADLIIRDYVTGRSANELSLEVERTQMKDLFDMVAEKAEAVDPTLYASVKAEYTRQAKSLERIESRMRRTEKQRFESEITQIRGLRDELFPGGGLQERYDNFLTIYLDEGEAMFDLLIDELDPLTEGLVVIQP